MAPRLAVTVRDCIPVVAFDAEKIRYSCDRAFVRASFVDKRNIPRQFDNHTKVHSSVSKLERSQKAAKTFSCDGCVAQVDG